MFSGISTFIIAMLILTLIRWRVSKMLSNTWAISDEIWIMSEFHYSELKCKSNCGLILLYWPIHFSQTWQIFFSNLLCYAFIRSQVQFTKYDSLTQKGPDLQRSSALWCQYRDKVDPYASESAISCQKCTPVELRCSWSIIEAKKENMQQQTRVWYNRARISLAREHKELLLLTWQSPVHYLYCVL